MTPIIINGKVATITKDKSKDVFNVMKNDTAIITGVNKAVLKITLTNN